MDVTITGSNTNFTQGSGTTVSFYNYQLGNFNTLDVSNIQVFSPTQIKATVSVPYKTFTGDYSVYVNDGSYNTLNLDNAFHVNGLTPPKLESITPNTANNGQTLDVTIIGSNTNFTQYNQGSATINPSVSFYSNQQGSSSSLNVYNVQVLSPTQIKATVSVPYETFTSDYSIYVNDGSYNNLYLDNAFHVNGLTPPKLESITPNTANKGQTLDVTITGSNTNFTQYNQGSGTIIPTVSFYNNQQGSSTTLNVYNVQVLSPTQIKATVSVPFNALLGDYDVVVSDNQSFEITLNNGFKVVSNSLNISKNVFDVLSVYPNPTSDIITIEMTDLPINSVYKCKVLNVLGQEVYTTYIQSNKTEISLKSLDSQGVLFVHVIDSKDIPIKVVKIVLE